MSTTIDADKQRLASETLQLLNDANAIIEHEHFVYVSGDHGSGWVDKDAIFPHTERIERLASSLAQLVMERAVDVVCGPATGGLILAQWMAHRLKALAVFTEHDPDNDGTHASPQALRPPLVLRRGYDKLVARRRVVVVDDIVNTGHSIRQSIQAVQAAGGQVVSAATLVTRGNVGAAGVGVDPFIYLLEYKIPAWPEGECQLCRAGRPINTTYAHGRDYLARKAGRT